MSQEKDIAEIRDLLREMPGKIGTAVSKTGPSVNGPAQRNSEVKGFSAGDWVKNLFGPSIAEAFGVNQPKPSPPVVKPPPPQSPAMNVGLLNTPAPPVMDMSKLGPPPAPPAMNMSLLVNQPSTPITAAARTPVNVSTPVTESSNHARPVDTGFADSVRDFADVIKDFKQIVQELKERPGEHGPQRAPVDRVALPNFPSRAFPSARTGVQVPTMGMVQRSR